MRSEAAFAAATELSHCSQPQPPALSRYSPPLDQHCRAHAGSGGASQLPRIGFGTYRVGEQHSGALKAALEQGVTLIDTSTNYVNGASEETVGAVLRAERVRRDSVTVVSKVGYIQGQNLIRCEGSTRGPTAVPLPDPTWCQQTSEWTGASRYCAHLRSAEALHPSRIHSRSTHSQPRALEAGACK